MQLSWRQIFGLNQSIYLGAGLRELSTELQRRDGSSSDNRLLQMRETGQRSVEHATLLNNRKKLDISLLLALGNVRIVRLSMVCQIQVVSTRGSRWACTHLKRPVNGTQNANDDFPQLKSLRKSMHKQSEAVTKYIASDPDLARGWKRRCGLGRMQVSGILPPGRALS